MTDQTEIVIIGCGNMGRSLAGGLVRAGWPAARLRGVDPDPAQRELAARATGMGVGDDPAVAAGADVVVLAVKPQVAGDTVRALGANLRARPPLLLSIAAGVPVSALVRWAGAPLPVVRAMPNTPALVGCGATGLFAGPGVSAPQRELAARLLGAVGVVVWVESEDHIDLVTALSGSGPAYFFLLMEALVDAAVAEGLPEAQARTLTLQTALGAAHMAQLDGADPARLRRQVTSPGGTTEQALRVLADGALPALIRQALAAARRRAADMARESGAV